MSRGVLYRFIGAESNSRPKLLALDIFALAPELKQTVKTLLVCRIVFSQF